MKIIPINEQKIRAIVESSLRMVFNEWRSCDRLGERDDDEDDEDENEDEDEETDDEWECLGGRWVRKGGYR